MTKKYWIYRIGDGPDPLGDAKKFDQTSTSSYGPADALEIFMKWMDEHSNFIDGYPQDEEYGVVDVETGEEHRFKVNTEFEPSFYIYEAK